MATSPTGKYTLGFHPYNQESTFRGGRGGGRLDHRLRRYSIRKVAPMDSAMTEVIQRASPASTMIHSERGRFLIDGKQF
ncbi:MAG: hypothetical protein HRF40_01835 [Nitrososphaera sp.]|jgi:hypothetical protein